MNYAQIHIGGRDRGLKFNQGAVDVYFQKLNYSELGASAIYATFYAGLIGNCIVKGEQADFDFEQVCEWVDELYEQGKKEEIERVCAVFADANSYKQRLAEITDRIRTMGATDSDEEKKKEVLT